MPHTLVDTFTQTRHLRSLLYDDVGMSRLPASSTVRRVEASAEQRTARIVRRVRAIPAGFVRTYGDIDPVAPRLVGLVLATIHDDLPWHRVVRADGSLAKGRRQRALLLAEGIPMRGERVDLRRARLHSDP
jgi:methylated-DNA-protein-cysteine methyltransferase-like protein